MFWPLQPIWVQLFAVYLLGAGCLVAVHLLRVAAALYPVSKRSQPSLQSICEGRVSAESISSSALTGSLPAISPPPEGSQIAIPPIPESSVSKTLREAEIQFRYAYDILSAKVAMAKGFVTLTMILTALTFVVSLSDIFRGAWAITSPSEPSAIVMRRNLVLAFGPLELGLIFCTIVYVLSKAQQHSLKRRKTTCDRFSGLIAGASAHTASPAIR